MNWMGDFTIDFKDEANEVQRGALPEAFSASALSTADMIGATAAPAIDPETISEKNVLEMCFSIRNVFVGTFLWICGYSSPLVYFLL